MHSHYHIPVWCSEPSALRYLVKAYSSAASGQRLAGSSTYLNGRPDPAPIFTDHDCMDLGVLSVAFRTRALQYAFILSIIFTSRPLSSWCGDHMGTKRGGNGRCRGGGVMGGRCPVTGSTCSTCYTTSESPYDVIEQLWSGSQEFADWIKFSQWRLPWNHSEWANFDIQRQISFMCKIFINIDQRRSLVYITKYIIYLTVFGACTSNLNFPWTECIHVPDPISMYIVCFLQHGSAGSWESSGVGGSRETSTCCLERQLGHPGHCCQGLYH